MDRLRRLMALSGLVLLGLGGQVAGMGAGDYASLDELLSDFVDPDEPGVVVLVNVGGTRESAARGMADLAEGRSIRVGDQFRIGSATKPFVAALVLQLVEEGRMSLDEPIATYLPPGYGAADRQCPPRKRGAGTGHDVGGTGLYGLRRV
jgi:D-alanyl-D-alanine carboxypeptidase